MSSKEKRTSRSSIKSKIVPLFPPFLLSTLLSPLPFQHQNINQYLPHTTHTNIPFPSPSPSPFIPRSVPSLYLSIYPIMQVCHITPYNSHTTSVQSNPIPSNPIHFVHLSIYPFETKTDLLIYFGTGIFSISISISSSRGRNGRTGLAFRGYGSGSDLINVHRCGS